LLTDAWMVSSTDGKNFTETHLSGPFDLQLAPLTPDGYFLGDYQALVYSGTQFEPLYAQTNPDATTVSTDVFFAFPPASSAAAVNAFVAQPALSTATLPPLAHERMSARTHAALMHRTPR
jgi:hypothetical protein